MKKKHIIWRVFAILTMVVLFAFILGYGTMMLWNWLIPDLFGGPVITFWQALGLVLLCKLLLGFPHNAPRSRLGPPKKENRREHWEARASRMTPEEKERMKDQLSRCMGGRWGWKSPREEEFQGNKDEEQPNK